MNNKIIWLIIFLKSQAYIVYDMGWFTCLTHLEGFYYVKTIEFTETFRNPPQIFFTLQYFGIHEGANEYQFFCESINTKSFTIRIIVVGQIPTGLTYLYQAYDDMRIEIINVFNLAQPKGNTYPHKNANAQNAILSLISLGYTGPIDFKIAISKVTKDSITVDLINNVVGKIENLKQIGFQILIGIEEAIKGAEIKFAHQSDMQFNVFNVNSIPGNQYEFTTSYQGFVYDPSKIVALSKKIVTTHPNNTFDYTIFTAPIVTDKTLVFTPCTSLQVFIIKYFKTIFTPLKLYSAIVTQKRDLIFLNNPQIYIKIEILNKIITQPQIYETLIDKSIKTFSIQIEINCKNIVQIKSLFRNCQNCLFQQNYHSNHYCSSNLTLLTFNFKLTQSILSYQQLIFIVEQSRFTLKQVLTNYVETEVELIDIILV
ncbi:unnamed protein product [Paramecium sonneborni]|uniref:H-type lectin domain-containing protein n=1 Tax=Paramecium sonneborni TaxID=65129 RepID=A0A8S1R4F5_9CILI|nr:unnamed protein product [Paramecium sonneborni]